MHAHYLFARNGKQAERVGIAHILLYGEGELGQVIKRFDVLGFHACFVERFLVERNLLVHALDQRLQTLKLKRFQVFTRHGLDFRLIVH